MTLIGGPEKIVPRYDGSTFSVTQICRTMSDVDPFAFVAASVLARKGKIGTEVHAQAHNLVLGYPAMTGDETTGYIDAVISFLDTVGDITPILIEEFLLYRDINGKVIFGGTLDLLFGWRSKVILLDWKSRKLMRDSDTRQLTGYDLLVNSNDIAEPDLHWVIELRSNGTFRKHDIAVTERSRVAFLRAATELQQGGKA